MNLSPAALLAAACFGVVIVLGVIAWWDLRRFLGRVTEIQTAGDLEDFKRVVARQMYLAFSAIALDVVGLGIVLVAMSLGLMQWEDMVLAGPVLLAFCLLLWTVRPAELAAQRLPVPNAELYEERERVVKSWKRRVFPDF